MTRKPARGRLGISRLAARHWMRCVADWAAAEFGAGDMAAGGVSAGGDIAVALAGVDQRISRVAANRGRARLDPAGHAGHRRPVSGAAARPARCVRAVVLAPA
jgi:hypothetical protein